VGYRSIVKEKETGQVAVVARPETPYFPEDTDIIWAAGAERAGKHTSILTTEFAGRFEEIGTEDPQPDMVRCRECVFLGGTLGGLTCLRFGSLHSKLVGRAERGEIRSTRVPTELFPDCQLSV